MEGLLLVFLALLAGIVLYLVLSQRHFQRVDYSQLVSQEEAERRMEARLEHVQRLVRELRAHDEEHRREMGRMVADAQEALSACVSSTRDQIIREVCAQPEKLDALLLSAASSACDTWREEPRPVRNIPGNPNLVRFLRSPRQQRIAELLEQGLGPQEISRRLGVSSHEVHLVGQILFGEKSA